MAAIEFGSRTLEVSKLSNMDHKIGTLQLSNKDHTIRTSQLSKKDHTIRTSQVSKKDHTIWTLSSRFGITGSGG